jgi:hypothetical protein
MPDPIVMDKPSWLRWPPNCCETCVAWQRVAPSHEHHPYLGRCNGTAKTPAGGISSVDSGDLTDSRYRCPAFVRRAGL